MCKKKLSAWFIGLFAFSVVPSVFAVDTGTVTFTGKIIEDTCDVNVNNMGANGTVTFSDLYPSAFGADDAEGESQAFDIALTGCDTNISNINIKFDGTRVANKGEEVLQATGSATNVGIRLLDWSNAAVKFDGSEPLTGSDKQLGTTGETTFSYTAKVVQVGDAAPTAGTYTAEATYSLIYR